MSTLLKDPNKETIVSPAINQQGIENHKKAAEHHLDAAKHYEPGNHDKAANSTVKAGDQNILANEALKKDAKEHAMKI
jgi:hypothetical protein